MARRRNLLDVFSEGDPNGNGRENVMKKAIPEDTGFRSQGDECEAGFANRKSGGSHKPIFGCD